MIGSMMYLIASTHLDLNFVLSCLSQFSSYSLKCNYTAVKRVFHYLAGTCTMSLVYTRHLSIYISLWLTRFSNANYASCYNTHHSITHYTFLSNGCAISWLSKKQNSVLTSTIESEYMALSTLGRQAL